jgi:hypothetical protein
LSQRRLHGLKSSVAVHDPASDWGTDRYSQDVPLFEDRAEEGAEVASHAPDRPHGNNALPKGCKSVLKRGAR